MCSIDRKHLEKFAEDGYIVLPRLVSPQLVGAARRAVADRLRLDPLRAATLAPTSASCTMTRRKHCCRRYMRLRLSIWQNR
jgi:hypothetical protein